MNAQPLSLFDAEDSWLPARKGEPTSRAAAQRINLRERKRQTMEAVRKVREGGPGSFTSDDVRDVLLWFGCSWADQVGSVRSRMSQLANDELLVRVGLGEGRCGSWVTTWQVTPLGAEWLRDTA